MKISHLHTGTKLNVKSSSRSSGSALSDRVSWPTQGVVRSSDRDRARGQKMQVEFEQRCSTLGDARHSVLIYGVS